MMRRRSDAVHANIAVAARARVAAANEILLEAARLLATSLELDDTLRQVMSLVIPRLADYSLLYLRGPDGSFQQQASAHVDESKAALLEELGRRYRPDLSDRNSRIGTVLSTRRPHVAPRSSMSVARRLMHDPVARTIHTQLAPISYLIVPLIAHDELLGSLVLAMAESGRRYSSDDLPLAELVGARAALAIENARLYRATREAQDRVLREAQLESQLARARLDALRAQLNPHFLFNALNLVAMLVRRGANDEALNTIISLSELLRRVLAVGTTLEVSLREEVTLVERYLEVERVRFRDRLTANVSIPPPVLDARVPGLLLQPLVENAIKHGFADTDGPGCVDIVARRDGRNLILSVSDDGRGVPTNWDSSRTTGLGLANLRERLARMYDTDYRLDLRRGDHGGAVVEVLIPYRTASGVAAAAIPDAR
jgi:LytS/YehU family sensor histidine kinase